MSECLLRNLSTQQFEGLGSKEKESIRTMFLLKIVAPELEKCQVCSLVTQVPPKESSKYPHINIANSHPLTTRHRTLTTQSTEVIPNCFTIAVKNVVRTNHVHY